MNTPQLNGKLLIFFFRCSTLHNGHLGHPNLDKPFHGLKYRGDLPSKGEISHVDIVAIATTPLKCSTNLSPALQPQLPMQANPNSNNNAIQ